VLEKVVHYFCCGLVAAIAFVTAAAAQPEEENVLVPVPNGYKVDFQRNDNNSRVTEMVPANETGKNWTEKLTVRVFYRLADVAPEKFKGQLEQLWSKACPGSESKPAKTGNDGGLPSITWMMLCKSNPSTGKPENTWLKVIQGADSLYVVEKAYKFAPTKAQERQWLAFLDKVSVCDPRVPERPCPETKTP